VATDHIRQNFPAIDLGDVARKRSFQITSEKETAKIQGTLDTFARHGLIAQYGRVQVIVIGERQRTYSLNVPPGMTFVWEDDIIDMPRLLKRIEALPTAKLERVAQIVRDELSLPTEHDPKNRKAAQGSAISEYGIPIRLPQSVDGKGIDPERLEWFNDQIQTLLAYAFGHTCQATPYDDFVFLLTVEKGERQTDEGYVPLDLTVHCHISDFVWAFREWSQFMIEGKTEWGTRARLKTLPGDQVLNIRTRFGHLVPHRVRRQPPDVVAIEELLGVPVPTNRPVNTSALLRILSIVLNREPIMWNIEGACPDRDKVLSLAAQIADHGFSWDRVRLDRADPERWEYEAR
jgi:hypothetical protein